MTKEELQAIAGLLDEKLKPINDRLDKMDSKLNNVEINLKGEITKINVKLENETDRTIKVLGEGHSIINRKLDEKIALENRVEKVEDRVSAVEYVLKKAE